MIKTLSQTLKISAISLLAVVAAEKAFAMDAAAWEEQQRRTAAMAAGYTSYPYVPSASMAPAHHLTGMQFDPSMMGASGYPSYHQGVPAAQGSHYSVVSGAAAYPGYGAPAGTYDPRLQYSMGGASYAPPAPMGACYAQPAAVDPKDAEIAALRAQAGKVTADAEKLGLATENLKLTTDCLDQEKERVKRRDAAIEALEKQKAQVDKEIGELRKKLTAEREGGDQKFRSLHKDYVTAIRENGELKKKARTLIDENAALRLQVSAVHQLQAEFSDLVQALMEEVETLRARPVAAAAPDTVSPSVARAGAVLAAHRGATNRFVRDGRINEEAGRIGSGLLMKAQREVRGCEGLAGNPALARNAEIKGAIRTLLDDRDVQRMISYDPRKARRGAPENPRAWSDVEFDAVIEGGIRSIEMETLAIR